MLVLKAVQRYQYLSEQPNKRRHISYILTKQYLLFALTRPSALHIRTVASSRTHRFRRASHMQWQAARACHASLPHTLHIYAKTEGHPHNYASPTSRECPQNQRKRIRLQITQYFEVYIRCCHTAACADTVQKKHFTTPWKSLFHGVGKALPHNGKARSARRYSHYGTQKRLSDVSEEPFSVFQSTEACRWKRLRRLTTRFPSHCLFSFENFHCKDFLLPETHIYSLSYILMPCQEAACSITRVPFTHALTPPPPCRLRCQRSARGTYVRSSMTLL